MVEYSRASGSLARLSPFLAPLLVSIYIPLLVAANLPWELLRARDFLWPIGVTLVVSTLGWGLGFAYSRLPSKAGLISVLAVTGYSSLGAVAELVEPSFGTAAFAATSILLLLYGILLASAFLAIVGARRRFLGSVEFLTVMGAVLVGWNLGKLLWSCAWAGRPPSPPVTAGIPAPLPSPVPARDIYLIILDKYTSSNVLASHFQFDNSDFEKALRQRGFVVPFNARTNYVHTFLELAAILNMRYLDDLTTRFTPNGAWELAYPLIENNRLAAFLRDRGYRIVSFPTEFGGTRQNRYSDLQLPAPRDVRPELYAGWVHLTAWPAIQAIGCRVLGCDPDLPPYQPSDPELMDWRFQALANLAGTSRRPQFVFAHLLVPHEPYIYGSDCRHVDPYWPRYDWTDSLRVRQRYVDQIRCINSKVLQTVDTIQARSRVPPIILIQSDHGHGQLGREIPVLGEVTREAVRERVSVFSAYCLPTVERADVPDSISPLNATRLVLRHYFRADLPPLPDWTYWSARNSPYRFERVFLQ